MAETWTTGQVATMLGVTEPWLQTLIRRGKLARPKIKNNKRVWTRGDLDAAREVARMNR